MDRPELIFQDIDSEFVKDEFYEDFQAPKFYDFCLPHQSVDADNWFRVSSPQSDALNAVPETTDGQEEPVEQELTKQLGVPAAAAASKVAAPTVAKPTALHRQAEEDLSGLFDKLLHCNTEQPKKSKCLDQQPENPPEGAGSKVTAPIPSAPACLKAPKPERKRMIPRSSAGAATAEIVALNQSKIKQQKSKKRNISQAGNDSSLPGKLNNTAKGVHIGTAVDQIKADSSSTSSVRLHHGCFVGNHKKLKTTCPRPFRLLTEERGALKELEFNKKMEQYLLDKDNFQPASSFGATVNYAAWGVTKHLMQTIKDLSKDEKSTSEKGARCVEPVGGRSQTEKKVQEKKQGSEKELQERELVEDKNCNKQVETNNVGRKQGGHDPIPYQPETEPEAEKVLEPSQVYGNSERGALKEIKHNRKPDNLVACLGENLFHSVLSGQATQVAKKTHAPAQKSGKEDKTTQKVSIANTFKQTGDFFFQAQRSLKKLTIPRAPKLHLPRPKRDCASKQVVSVI